MAERLTDVWGIDSGYFDIEGRWWETSASTRRALLRAMGVDADEPEPPEETKIEIVRPGRRSSLRGPAELLLEDGTRLEIADELPPDLPFGYHEWRPPAGRPVRIVSTPGRCCTKKDPLAWGWTAQLYALRSERSWGMGDLADLRELGRWSRERGASLILVNPLGAAMPVPEQAASPYYPSSRRFRNPLYLCVGEVPGADSSDAELAAADRAGRALNANREIDRAHIFPIKMDALERLFARFEDSPAFEAYRREQGRALEDFAAFCALAERYGRGFPDWPSEYRRPGNAAVARFASEARPRIRFHEWLQWQLDQQLGRAGREIAVLHDFPVGVDPHGADGWVYQDVLAIGTRVGAPPDDFAVTGQDWGVPPFIPHKLRARGYQPLIETLRALFRHAGGLRIDHVMGLFRLFWIPEGLKPSEGSYVRYAADELLAIVALESHRAGVTIIGEDLGTVEEGVRERLAEHGILSYRVVWFEDPPPSRYPSLAMATVTTHDLPTVAGLWSGSDPVGPEIRARVDRLTGLEPGAPVSEVVLALHRALAEAPSQLVAATLEDAMLATERPNVPALGFDRRNWSRALPMTLEELEQSPFASEIARTLDARSRRTSPQTGD